MADALHKAKHFVLGCPNLLIATDHKPLIDVFQKSLVDIQNPRLFLIPEKTLRFKFRVIQVEGKLYNGPDYMSRQGHHKDHSYQKEARINVCHALTGSQTSSFAQQLDSALIASMQAALVHLEQGLT